MPNKKKIDFNVTQDSELEHRVDVLMDPKLPDPSLSTASASVPDPKNLLPIDIFESPASSTSIPIESPVEDTPSSAPKVPASLLKKIKSSESSKKPAQKDVASVAVGPLTPEKIAVTVMPATMTSPTPTPELSSIVESDVDSEDPALNNPATDAAVEDIALHDSDELLAAEDSALASRGTIDPPKHGSSKKLSRFFKSKWIWLFIIVIVLGLFGVPLTRYKIIGLVIKKSFTVTVTDSKTNTPVSDSEVSLDGHSTKTDANGKVVLRVPVGKGNLSITKQYYKSDTQSVFVGLNSVVPVNVQLAATGRQVPVSVINKISGKPVAGVTISVLNTTAKTDKNGKAIIVLPISTSLDSATLTLSGYNATKASVTVTNTVVATNTFSLTPSGKIYFLSNDSGTIDVVKTNLDGGDRQTVLAGTGEEDPNNTVLLASSDWHYLVLEAQRSSAQPALYLIDTSTDKLTEFDSDDVSYSLVGWSGDNFVYDEIKNSVATSTAGHELLKSYDATNQELNQLDEDSVMSTGNDYAYQEFGHFSIIGDQVIYTTQWYTSGSPDLSNESDTVRGVKVDDQVKKDYLSLPAANISYFQAAQYQPQAIYYSGYNTSDAKTYYYVYQDDAVASSTVPTAASFNQQYPNYFSSPSGSASFWSELHDGQTTLFSGDANAQSQKAINSLVNYQAFGWYSNNYLLATKDGDELYVMPVTGAQTPLKITNYYKPPQAPNYGYESLISQ